MMGDSRQPEIRPSIRSKIIESVTLNRLTIIVGPTGSGKSTLIPPLIIDAVPASRVLVSLPRRLAVVAIAKRVANQSGCVLGEDDHVGFHVGNHNLSTNKTKLLFITAGILLEEMKNNGVDALTKFSCVIIDECHERSPESDLVLTLAKRFMKMYPKIRFRLILMSATFDHKRYTSYFKNVPGCDIIDTINLETAESFKAYHTQVQSFYLENLPIPESKLLEHKTFIRNMQKDPNADLDTDRGRSLSDSILALIRTLVTCLDDEEPISAPFLIFVPTYKHLEQLYNTLSMVNDSTLTLNVLHSAIDIEDCMRSLETASRDKNRRHVLLASAIADSSVTIPGVTCVIDLCRSLEVRYDISKRKYDAKTVWCSASIADQRKGRTGRTCPGRVFRFVHESFFIRQLEQWDVPQLSMSSCHNEVLGIVCADKKLRVEDPRGFFDECLDPPESNVIDDSIAYLIEIGACREVFKRNARLSTIKVLPTEYGSMMSALPMSVTDAEVVLEGGRIGLLHETLAMMAIINHRPAPIIHHFGDNEYNKVLLQSYYPDVIPSNKNSVAIASLSAYLYWDTHWNRKYEKEQFNLFQENARNHQFSDTWAWSEEDDIKNTKWCKEKNLNPSSMKSIKEIIESTINALYLRKHEPDWLRCSNLNPKWKCISSKELESTHYLGSNILTRIYGGHDKTYDIINALTKLIVNRSALAALPHAESYFGVSSDPRNTITIRNKDMACIHFLMGTCKYGNNCKNLHSWSAPRPLCRFHPNCSKGERCIYSHGDFYSAMNSQSTDIDTGKTESKPLIPVLKELSLGGSGVLGWFITHYKSIVLLGEGNFEFSKSLITQDMPPLLATTDVLIRLQSGSYPIVKENFLLGVDATRLHTNRDFIARIQRHHLEDISIVWNFPFITDQDENTADHEILLRDTFQSIKILFDSVLQISNGLFCIGLQGDQFSRWNVFKSALSIGWKLQAWDSYNHTDFVGYIPRRCNGEVFPTGSTRFYIFKCGNR